MFSGFDRDRLSRSRAKPGTDHFEELGKYTPAQKQWLTLF